MSGPQEQFDREADQLERDLECGCISQSDFNASMRELRYAYRDAMEESCWDAYDRERERW